MDTFRTVLARAVTVGVLLSGANVAPAAAATRSWVGGAGDAWSVAANWDPAVTPVDGDDLVFTALGSAASVNDLNITINSIEFQVDHEIGGNDFVLTSGISSSAAGGTLSILLAVTLGGPQTWATQGNFTVSHIALNGHAWTLNNDQDFDIDQISGAGAIIKGTSGILRLWDDSSFSGPMTINAGTVEVRHPNGLGIGDQTPGNGTTVAAGASLIVIASNPFSLAAEALTLQGTGVGNAGALQTLSTDPVTFTGPIELAATTHVSGGGVSRTMIFDAPVKGPGDLVILESTVAVFASNANTVPNIGFAGAGVPTLRVGTPMALAAARINVPAGATLDINDSGTDVLGLDGAGSVTLGATAGSLTVRNTLPSTFNGDISGAGGLLIKDGPGMLTLGGVNTFGIGPRIDAGTLRVTSQNALGAGDGTENTGTLVLDGATLALDTVDVGNERIHLGGNTQAAILQVMGTNPSSITGPVVMTQQAAVTGTDGATLTFNGALTIATPVSVTNARLVLMNPANSVAGPVTVNAGAALEAGAAGVFNTFTEVALNSGTFNLNGRSVNIRSLTGNGVLAFGTNGGLIITSLTDTTFAGTSTGTGGLLKAGAGALTLSGPFTVTGNVTVNGGSLIIAHDQAVVTTPRINVALGAALIYTVAATVPYRISSTEPEPRVSTGRCRCSAATSPSRDRLARAAMTEWCA